MRNVSVNWCRLLCYSLLFLLFSVLVTVVLVLGMTGEFKHLLQLEVQLSGIELAFSLAMFVCIPLLMIRFMVFFYRMVIRGRRQGIAILCYQNLFNPFNFLLFPSLLNPYGLESRRRCLVSIILLLILYLLIFFDSDIKPMLQALYF